VTIFIRTSIAVAEAMHLGSVKLEFAILAVLVEHTNKFQLLARHLKLMMANRFKCCHNNQIEILKL